MPVSYIPSDTQLVARQKTTARKRRRNQNTEIEELGDLLPVVPVKTGKQGIDKISVLRLASTYMRFREFLTTVYGKKTSNGNGFSSLLSKAIDGFLVVMDKDANILFSSETITEYVGLSQQDVIGQSLFDLAHADDVEVITENLKPKGITPTQFRQFYVRFKLTVSPGRVQLSRSTSHIMVQVSGHLKLHAPQVLGLVAECRLIESSSSILELSIPQSSFTTTSSLDLKIISVDTKVKEVIGFEPDDIIGTKLADYFHPADYADMIPCEKLLNRTGHAVSPIFRFMTSSGEWVWVQLDGLVRFKEGTNEPQFLETKCKVVSSFGGRLKFIEQKELYAATHEVDPAVKEDFHRDAYFLDQLPSKPCAQEPEPVVNALQCAKMSAEAVDSVLHSRELGYQQLPTNLKRLKSSSTHSPKSSPALPDSITTNGTPSPSTSVSSLSSHGSKGSTSSIQIDLSTGQPIFSPPSADSIGQITSPESQSITSPPSVFTGVHSPDSGISSSVPPSASDFSPSPWSNGGSVSSTKAAFGGETTILSPENQIWTSTENSVSFPQFSKTNAPFQIPSQHYTAPQSSVSFSTPTAIFTQQQQQQQQPTGFLQSYSVSQMDTTAPPPLPSTVSNSGTGTTASDTLLEQLLCEAVVLNSYSDTSQLRPQQCQSGLPFPSGAPQATEREPIAGYIPGSSEAGGASVNLFPTYAGVNGHPNVSQNSTEIQEILQEFL